MPFVVRFGGGLACGLARALLCSGPQDSVCFFDPAADGCSSIGDWSANEQVKELIVGALEQHARDFTRPRRVNDCDQAIQSLAEYRVADIRIEPIDVVAIEGCGDALSLQFLD